MVIFLNDRGEIITSAPVEVGRNSVNANEMIIVAPADSALASAVVYTAFRLPNGVEVFGGLATDESGSSIPAPADSLGVNIPEGQEQAFVAWRQPIGSNLTKVSGIVGYTIYCVTESAKTSATGTFSVNRATTIDIPTTIPTVGAWEQIATAIAQIQGDLSELRADVGEWSDPEREESLCAAVEAAEVDIEENADRIAENAENIERNTESIEQLRANVGTRPMAGYTEADTIWSVIGNRPPIFARSTLWERIHNLGELATSLQDDFLSVKGIAEEALNNSEENAKSIEKTERALRNLYSVSQGVSYVDDTVTSVAYEAPIPAKAAPWAHLDRVGGASTRVLDDAGEHILTENKPTALRVMGKNLLDLQTKAEITGTGITASYDAETGVYTLNGTSNDRVILAFYPANPIPLAANQTYTISVEYVSGSVTVPSGKYCVAYLGRTINGANQNWIAPNVTTANTSRTETNDVDCTLSRFWFFVDAGVVLTNYKCKVQLERGETATAYTKPSQTISTTELPDLSDLDGWGQGVPSVGGNYIEFTDDGRVLYQRTTMRRPLTGTGYTKFTNELVNGKKCVTAYLNDAPGINNQKLDLVECNEFEGVSNEVGYYAPIGERAYLLVYSRFLKVYRPEFEDLDDPAATFNAECAARYAEGNPIIIEYALATLPDPIDITDRFNGFDGFIEGQGNGSVIVENTAKADLPTTISYIVSLRS